jgi:hypothetical protein
MSEDLLQYDRMFDEALRGVVRKVLRIVAGHGLPGDHHFFLTFRTDYPGVEISESLRRQYPEEMTIVLQKVFWDLEVSEHSFTVGLSFNAVRQHLVIPFDALTVFQDRSVNFTLQFQQAADISGDAATAAAQGVPDNTPEGRDVPDSAEPAHQESPPGEAAGGSAENDDNVITLDTFRKK